MDTSIDDTFGDWRDIVPPDAIKTAIFIGFIICVVITYFIIRKIITEIKKCKNKRNLNYP